MRVLFVSTYPELGPSARYRIVQFLEPLKAHGVEGHFLPLMTNEFFKRFYKPGNYLYKGGFLALALAKRLKEALDARHYDVVFVQREAAIIGPPVFEALARYVARRPLVFDLDDAIFHSAAETKQASAHPFLRKIFKDPGKAAKIAGMADEVIAANAYTGDWARAHCDRVTIIPTVVDGDLFRPRTEPAGSKPVIGWVGSHSAATQLELVVPALQRLAAKRSFKVRLVGAGRDFAIPGVEVENVAWSLEREVDDFRNLDIGICPLFDDAWSRGKPGFKPLIYMASGVPQVSTPIGGVTQLLKEGEHGYFARTPDEWFEKLDRLLADPALRTRMGRASRTAFERGSTLKSETPRLFEVLLRARASRLPGARPRPVSPVPVEPPSAHERKSTRVNGAHIA